MKGIFFSLILLIIAGPIVAQDYCSCLGKYIFAQDAEEQYLGKISENSLDSESIINEYGDYGSSFSSTSIRNSFSDYGSSFGFYSAYSNNTTSPP